MAIINLGTNAQDFESLGFTYELLDTLRNSPTLSSNATTATATWHRSFDNGGGGTVSWDNIVTFHGTNLTSSNGVVTSIEFSVRQDGTTYQEFEATGFTIGSSTMLSAIAAASSGNTAQLKAVFEGMSWALDTTNIGDGHYVFFQGTGGDDTVTMSTSQDELGLDGGTDNIKLGGGDDTIYFYNALGYSAAGQSKVDGGAGADSLILDYGTYTSTAQYQHLTGGMTVNLSKAVDFGDFSVKFKSVEYVMGTRYTDTIIGTNAKETLDGGGDMLIGGGGADTLISTAGVDDFFGYLKASDSTPGKNHDIIIGFEAGLDIIDLGKLDSGTKSGDFRFIGDKALKHVGDLRVEFINHPGTDKDYYLVEANLDKDKAAELQIEVHSLEHLTKADFML